MKKFLAVALALCLICLAFSGCTRDEDRAKNNGIVSDSTDTDTPKDTTNDGIMGDLEEGASDIVEDITDAVDDMLDNDTKETTPRQSGVVDRDRTGN